MKMENKLTLLPVEQNSRKYCFQKLEKFLQIVLIHLNSFQHLL